jgi:hypothetical protein
MQVRHLCHRVTDRLVEGTFSGFSTMEVGERDPEHQSGLGSGKNFVSITEDDDNVG